MDLWKMDYITKIEKVYFLEIYTCFWIKERKKEDRKNEKKKP